MCLPSRTEQLQQTLPKDDPVPGLDPDHLQQQPHPAHQATDCWQLPPHLLAQLLHQSLCQPQCQVLCLMLAWLGHLWLSRNRIGLY